VFVIAVIIVYFAQPHLERLVRVFSMEYSNSLSALQEVLIVFFFFLLGLSFVLLLIAYVTLFCFSLHAAFIEKKGPIESVKRSFSLVLKNFKEVYGYFILFTLISYALNIALEGLITLAASSVFLIVKVFNFSVEYFTFTATIYNYAQLPKNIISWLLISPLSSIMLTMLYFNYRYQLEGYDLLWRLKQLTAEEGASEE
jgi:hypothetical protein